LETAEFHKTSQDFEIARKNHSLRLLCDSLEASPAHSRELYHQARDLEASHIAEILDGENRNKFEFESRDGKLYALQPEGVVDWQAMHRNGVGRAEAIARDNPRFDFYTDIARAELEEAQAQEAMVQTGEPATLFSISLAGDDIASSWELSQIGRNPEARRAFVRASVFDGQKLHLYSCSKDSMSTQDAIEIYKDFFKVDLPPEANSIDILRGCIQLPGAHHDLLDRIVPPAKRETYRFVLENPDLLSAHMDSLQSLASQNLSSGLLAEYADNLRYDIMSSYTHRFEGRWIDLGSLADSVVYAGAIEREAGTQYPGCDTIVAQKNTLAKTGYVNAQGLELSLLPKEFDSEFCPNCLPKPAPGKKVKAWRKGDRLGCKDCGHEVDVCTKRIVHQGKKTKPRAKIWSW